MTAGIISCITAMIGCFVLVFKWYTRTKSRIERVEEIFKSQKEYATKRGVEIAEKNTDAMEDSNDKLLSDIDAVLRVRRKKNNTTQ